MIRWYFVLVFIFLNFAQAQHEFGNLVINEKLQIKAKVTSTYSEVLPTGFQPLRIELSNDALIEQRFVLRCRSVSEARGSELEYTSEFTLTNRAGAQDAFEVMVPLVSAIRNDYSGVATELNLSLAHPLGVKEMGHMSRYDPAWRSVAVSRRLAERNLTSLTTHGESAGGTGSFQEFGCSFEAAACATDRRGWTGVDVVMMTDSEWKSLTGSQKKALLDWNQLGGHLHLYSGRGSATLGGIDSKLSPSEHPRMLGSLELFSWDGTRLDEADVFDRCKKKAPRLAFLAEQFRSGWPLKSALGIQLFNVWIIILILIAFGILVAPVNLFVFAKSGQRHRLFITTPLISLVTCLLLFGIILIGDRAGGKGVRFTSIALVPGGASSWNALIQQEQCARTGLLLGRGFSAPEKLWISPLVLKRSQWTRIDDGMGGGKSAKFSRNTDGKELRGDWFQSRSEQAHFLETIRSTRARIERMEGADDVPELVSNLGCELDGLFYRDPAGAWWKAAEGEIASGAEIPLQSSAQGDFATWWAEKIREASEPRKKALEALIDQDSGTGMFFASVLTPQGELAAIETLESVKWNVDRTVLTGVVE